MGLLDDDTTATSTGTGNTITVPGVQLPQFFPTGMQDFGLCESEDALNQAKQNLEQFRQIYRWTKAKFAAQEKAADIALELTKSRNQLIATLARTALKQAKSDADLAAILQAFPQMVQAIAGTVNQKKEKKVTDFKARLEGAAKGGTKGASGSQPRLLG